MYINEMTTFLRLLFFQQQECLSKHGEIVHNEKGVVSCCPFVCKWVVELRANSNESQGFVVTSEWCSLFAIVPQS